MARKQLHDANTQAKAGRGGVVPPVDRQFGKPNGNPQGRGFWKKEDTPRYKLESMMKLTASQLQQIANAQEAPLFERKLAQCIYTGKWKEIEGMINQVYGLPAQEIKQTNIELKPILPKKKKEKK